MAKTPSPSDVADKFMLRLPEGMRDRLKVEAEANKRSMNAEIVSRLEASLDPVLTQTAVTNLSDAELRNKYDEINRIFGDAAEKLGPILSNMNVFIKVLNERGIGPLQENEKREAEKKLLATPARAGKRAIDLD